MLEEVSSREVDLERGVPSRFTYDGMGHNWSILQNLSDHGYNCCTRMVVAASLILGLALYYFISVGIGHAIFRYDDPLLIFTAEAAIGNGILMGTIVVIYFIAGLLQCFWKDRQEFEVALLT